MQPMPAAQPGFHAELIGGTLPGIAGKISLQLDLTRTDKFLLHSGSQELQISYARVNSIEYGQNVSRRFVAAAVISPVLILAKTHKHYITLGYADVDGTQQALVLQVSKGDIRSVLAGLEARTGRRVEFQDNDARKAGQ
jgi:hypothetical protein